jgi:hypothetical protein
VHTQLAALMHQQQPNFFHCSVYCNAAFNMGPAVMCNGHSSAGRELILAFSLPYL